MSARKRLKEMQEFMERDLEFAKHMANLYRLETERDPSNLKAAEFYNFYSAETDVLQRLIDRFTTK